MSRKLQLTLPQPVAEQLWQLAADADQPPGRLARQLLENAIGRLAEGAHGEPLPPAVTSRSAPISTGDPAPPPWIEPPGADTQWRSLAWGAVAALHARYPQHLAAIPADWWQHNHHLERITALAHWRHQLDDAATDPRDELHFHEALTRLASEFDQASSSAQRPWSPADMPSAWIRRR